MTIVNEPPKLPRRLASDGSYDRVAASQVPHATTPARNRFGENQRRPLADATRAGSAFPNPQKTLAKPVPPQFLTEPQMTDARSLRLPMLP